MNDRDPFDLAGQEIEKKQAKDRQKLADLNEAEDLRWILSNKRGRRFFWKILSWCGIYRSSFTGNSTTFYNEGMRTIGLKLVDAIHEYCPERYTEMVKEAKEDASNRKFSDSSARK